MIAPTSALLAQTISTTKYSLARTESLGMWWHWLLVAGIGVAVVAFVVFMYRRDAHDLPAPVAIALAGLRIFALAGLLFTFMNLEHAAKSAAKLQGSYVA